MTVLFPRDSAVELFKLLPYLTKFVFAIISKKKHRWSELYFFQARYLNRKTSLFASLFLDNMKLTEFCKNGTNVLVSFLYNNNVKTTLRLLRRSQACLLLLRMTEKRRTGLCVSILLQRVLFNVFRWNNGIQIRKFHLVLWKFWTLSLNL